MSFVALCQKRRSIRKYTDQMVAETDLQQILQAALMSPSSKRCNPWQFVVITDKQILEQLASCRTYGSQMLQESAVAIAVCVDSSLTDTWQCDGAIAAHNMLLAAEDIGLGACWVQIYNREGAEELVKELTHVPETLNVLCLVSIGYKNEERKKYDLAKLQYDKIHYGTF